MPLPLFPRIGAGARPRTVSAAVAMLLLACSMGGVGRAVAAAEAPGARPISELSIEELMNVEVVSVSKKAQKLSSTAAAIFVISAEDIHRSGARSLPEVLRLAPGVDVAWIGGDAYSVSIRGFGGRFANKLLVLQDGRSLYTSLFGGVFWEKQLPMLEDVERIEIIRGPGAAIWGANAVNGVINIITRSSRDTLGGLVAAAAGTKSQYQGDLRYGLRLDDDSTMRVYGRLGGAHPGLDRAGNDVGDSTRNVSGGLRYDRDLSAGRLTVQAGSTHAYSNQDIVVPVPTIPYVATATDSESHDESFALGRLERTLDSGGELDLQAYYDHTDLFLPGLINERRDVVDLDLQHHLHLGQFHDVIWGLGLRYDADNTAGSDFVQFDPAAFTRHTASLMAQDEIALVPERLHLTVGAKFERDSLAGSHTMPDVRMSWTLSPSSTLWAAASRAIRSPSRAEHDVYFLYGPTIPAAPPFLPLPLIPTATGTSGFGVETETAYQVGLRLQPTHALSVDMTGYASRYASLRTDQLNMNQLTPGLVGGVPYLQLPLDIVNGVSSNEEGVEAAVDWHVRSGWRLQATASHVWISVATPTDLEGLTTATPETTVSLRSSLDLDAFRLDAWLRFVGAITLDRIGTVYVPAYQTLDLRVAREFPHGVELALVGQNLLHAQHLEYVSDNIVTPPRQVARTVYVSVRVEF